MVGVGGVFRDTVKLAIIYQCIITKSTYVIGQM